MDNVTTLPNAFTALEETRRKIRDDIYEFLESHVMRSDDDYELSEKIDKLENEIRNLIPKEKIAMFIELSDLNNELDCIREERLIKFLINHGEELKNTIVSF